MPSAPAPDHPAASLRDQTLSGVRWMSLTRLVAESAALIASIALARLVAPAEFGRTAAAVFFAMLAVAVSQQGVGSFLVQLKVPSRTHYQAASFVSLSVGMLGTTLMLVFAVAVAPMIFGGRTAYFLALSSPVWLLAGLTAVPIAQLQRQLSFGRLGFIEASASLVGPGVAVVLALRGMEGESLIIGGLVASGVTAALGWLLSRPPRPGWHPAEMRELAHYGGPVTGASMLYAAVRNIDYLLLAAFIPAFQVGLYMRAFALGSDYQSKVSQILLNVSFPVLSRAKTFEEMRRMRARMIRVHATVLFPLLFTLIAIAPQFVPWLYGERWAGAGSLTQILAVGGMIAAVGTGTGPLLMATGHPRALLVYNGVGFIAYTLAVLASVSFGVTAVCVAVVTVRLVSFVTMQYLVVERRVGIPILETVRDDVTPALAAGLPLLVVTLLGLRLCLDASLPVFVAIAVSGVVGLAVYAAIMRTFFPATWADVGMLARQLVPSAVVRRLSGPLRRRRAPAEARVGRSR